MGETCEGAGASSCNWRYVHTHTFISLGLATEQPVCVCCCPSPATSIATHSAIESNCCFSQPPPPIVAHLRRHHLLHANFHSFGNYFRTLSAPMARTRWHIMYSTAPWKLHQLRNRCIYFGNRARAMSLNPCTNQTGSGIRITAHLRHMNQCIPHHSIWRHIYPTGQTDWQTTQSATVLFVVVERNFVWQQHPLQLLYSSKCHSQKGEKKYGNVLTLYTYVIWMIQTHRFKGNNTFELTKCLSIFLLIFNIRNYKHFWTNNS